MKFTNVYKKPLHKKKRNLKLITKFSIAFLIALSFNLTSYATFQGPNNIGEIEPNDTRETAQTTYLTNEIAERFSADDFSGRYSIRGRATSSDDDWYKIDLPGGIQYLSVVHAYGDNATYVELLDADNNEIIPKKYGTRYNITKFNSDKGTYYIHITGATEKENIYSLFVGTPMLSSDEVKIRFDAVRTNRTIKKTFSLADEDILPDDAIVTKITLDSLSLGYSGARIANSNSTKNVTFPYHGDEFATNLGALNMKLKSTWNVEFYPNSTVKLVPDIRFFYFYPVYDNTKYPPYSTILK